MNKAEIRQEIEYLMEEIGQDEALKDTSDYEPYHEERWMENRNKLAEYEELLLLNHGEVM